MTNASDWVFILKAWSWLYEQYPWAFWINGIFLAGFIWYKLHPKSFVPTIGPVIHTIVITLATFMQIAFPFAVVIVIVNTVCGK